MTKIALCMIVRNSEECIEKCLASFRPFVDAVFIYDTGSTDGTFARLAKMKAHTELHVVTATGLAVTADTPLDVEKTCIPLAPIKVKKGKWRDDFAWARAQSFAMADDSFTHYMWADDDDILEGGAWLRQFAFTMPPECDGAVLFYDYARDETGQNVCQLWRERLIRTDRGFTWRNPVHEVLVPPEGRQANFAQIPASHVRYIHDRPADRYPPERNLKILMAAVEKAKESGEPLDPRTLAYLGTEHMARGEWADAARWLHEYTEHPEAGWSDERMQVHHKLAGCLRALGNPLASVEIEMRAHLERDDWAEIPVGLAQAFAMLGRWDRTEREARRALALGMPNSSLILNPIEFTLLPLVLIADACVNQGRGPDAMAAVQQALALYPENPMLAAKAQEIDRAVAETNVVDAIMLLREQLVRHDENLKAHNLMENVPYWLDDNPQIVKARSDQRRMVDHYLHPEEYLRWYADEEHESTVPDEAVENVGDILTRAKRLLEGLRDQEVELGRKPKLLDLGGNDMWMACYLWKQGEFVADAVELNKPSIAKGIKRMKAFGAPGRLVHGDLHDAPKLMQNGSGQERYDAVSLFEVIEHVHDIEKTLAVCEKMLKPGGRIYISTPNGAYERGMLDAWSKVEIKGHLRAITIHQLADIAKSRGEVVELELQHQGRLAFLSYKPRKRKGRVSLYAGASWEPWSPASINEGGLGGSETALVQVAARLAMDQNDVTVYSGCEPGLFAGALARQNTAWDPNDDPDLLIVSRLVHVFDNPIGARTTALWCHDHSYGDLFEERASKIDHVVCLSDWQRERFLRLYPFLDGKVRVIRNGVTITGPDGEDRYPDAQQGFKERKPRCVYSSSADRGLDVMLTMWPRIREQVPDAELHVFYGWNVFDRVAIGNPGLLEYKQRVFALVEAAGGEEGGVFMRGRIGQRDLAAEMMQARVWTYPTAFLETSCIGAMEARASGLPIVTSALGALNETVGSHGILLHWEGGEDEPFNREPAYQDAFVSETVRLLSDEKHWTGWHARALRGKSSLDWSRRVAEWEALIPAKVPARKRARAKVAA